MPKKSRIYIISSIIVLLLALIITNFYTNSSKNLNNYYVNFSQFETLPIEDAFGPESLTFDRAGGRPYTGVSDGRIIRWDQDQGRWVDFAFTSPRREECEREGEEEKWEHICGRPLGLRFYGPTGDLYIADAYMGLLVVGPEGGLATRVASHVEGVPFGFTNGVDVDQRSGVVYFTDSSMLYPRRNYISVILTGDKTGRLMKFDPQTQQVTVLARNLSFPNGVALSKDNQSLLIVETTTCRILRYWLESTKAGTLEVVAQLLGYPDNIKPSANRDQYWVGIYSKRGEFLKWVVSFKWVGKIIVNFPFNAIKLVNIFIKLRAKGLAIKLNEDGKIIQVLEEIRGGLKFVSEVVEWDGKLWFGSVVLPFASVYDDRN